MKVLHVGPPSSVHTQIAALAYEALGYHATFLNTRRDAVFETVPGTTARVVNPWTPTTAGRRVPGQSLLRSVSLASHYLGRRDARLYEALHRLARECQFDLIVGTWGAVVLEGMIAAQDVFPKSAVVYNTLSVPDLPVQGIDWKSLLWRGYGVLFDAAERQGYRRMLRRCDVRIFTSPLQERWLRDRGMLPAQGADVLRLERFSERFFPRVRKPRVSASDGEPHVIHLGGSNFSGTGIDDVRDQFARLAAAGVHVHFASRSAPPAMATDLERFYHWFPIFPNTIGPELAEHTTQFDAAVMMYNIDRTHDRFRNVLPTRFLFALITGVPIALPRGIFESCEAYVREHGNGFTYGSERELADLLKNSAHMTRVTARAEAHSATLSLERHLGELESIFQHARVLRDARLGGFRSEQQSRETHEHMGTL